MTDEDLISRQAVMNCFKKHQPYMATRLYAFEKELLELPSVIKHSAKRSYWTKDFICANCGCKCYPMDIDFGDYNYCPNCGAYNEEVDTCTT